MKSKKIQTIYRLSKLLLPFIIAIIGFIILRLYLNEESSTKLSILMLAYFVPPLGKESIIPIGVGGGQINIPFFNISLTVPSIDPFVVALAIAFVVWQTCPYPVLGPICMPAWMFLTLPLP